MTIDKKSSHNPYMQDYAKIFCIVFNWLLVLVQMIVINFELFANVIATFLYLLLHLLLHLTYANFYTLFNRGLGLIV